MNENGAGIETGTNTELSIEIKRQSEVISEITSEMAEEINNLHLDIYQRECLYDFLFTACTAILGGIKYAYRGVHDLKKREDILRAIRFRVGLYGSRVSEMDAETYALHQMPRDPHIAIQERFEIIKPGIGIIPQLSEIIGEIEDLNLDKEVEKLFYSFLFEVSTAVIKSAESVYKVEHDPEKCREILKPIILKVKLYERAVNDLRSSLYQDCPF